MSSRLYEEYMGKKKIKPTKFRKGQTQENETVCFEIPLKGGASKVTQLDQDFVRVIEYEYAVKYLEYLGTQPTQTNIANLLKNAPLSSCELSTGWNNSGWLADVLYIYPFKKNKKSFEKEYDLFALNKSLEQDRPPSLSKSNRLSRLQHSSIVDPRRLHQETQIVPSQQVPSQLLNSTQPEGANVSTQAAPVHDISNTIHKLKHKYMYPYAFDFRGTSKTHYGALAAASVPKIKKEVMASSPNPAHKEEMQEKQQMKNTQSEARMMRIRSAVGRVLESPSSAYLLRGSSAMIQSQRKSTTLRSKAQETRGTVQDTISTWSPGSKTEDGEEERDTLKEKLKSFALPLGSIENKKDVLKELQRPITSKVEEIGKSLSKFVKQFPVVAIPHITETKEVNDIIHIGYGKRPSLKHNDIKKAFDEITKPEMARLTGMVSHFCYWTVFGHLSDFPIDNHYLKQLFVSISQIQAGLCGRYKGRRIFAIFIMPMVLLAIRHEVESIFRDAYPLFFKHPDQESSLLRCLNGVITYILDPNLYYSRFSFLESDRHAIRLKTAMNRSNLMPKITSKFYTRSALIQQLIPVPSDGKVRATFRDASSPYTAPIPTTQSPSAPASAPQTAHLAPVKSFADLRAQPPTERPRVRKSKSGVNFPRSIGFAALMKREASEDPMGGGVKSGMLGILSRAQMYQIALDKVNQGGLIHSRRVSTASEKK